MGVTSNGLPYPENSDFVADGAMAIKDLAEKVDLRSGLIKIVPSSVSGTGASINARGSVAVSSGGTSVSIEGVFSSDFDAYEIIVSNLRFSAGDNLIFRLRVSGTDANSAYYYTTIDGGASYSGSGTVGSSANQSSLITQIVATNVATASGRLFVINPAIAEETTLQAYGVDPRTNGAGRAGQGGFHNANTAYTGFTFATLGGTATITNAKISIYGYN